MFVCGQGDNVHFAVINLVLGYGQSCPKFWVQGGQERVQGTMQVKTTKFIRMSLVRTMDLASQWIRIYVGCTLLESQQAEQTCIVSRDHCHVHKQDSIVSFLSLWLES
jgi:hypothetical protein